MPEPATNIEYSPWNEWQANDYLSEYYNEVMPDEQHAISFLCEMMKKLPEVPVALDYGCGPTIHHAAALVPKAKEIHLAEYLPDNLAALQRWIDNEGDVHDWSSFTDYILRMEGNFEPTDADIKLREAQSRKVITKLIQSDAGDTDPLGPDMRGHYPLVTTHYCAEGATSCKETWALYMTNICSLVAPGGTIILSSCGAADFYTVGDRMFPCAGVNAVDIVSMLQKNGFADIDLRVRSVPDHSEQGYGSVIFACATKMAE